MAPGDAVQCESFGEVLEGELAASEWCTDLLREPWLGNRNFETIQGCFKECACYGRQNASDSLRTEYQAMCGISGYYGFERDEPLLRLMNAAQAHRGPDGEGFYIDDEVGFGHLRLAIIDRRGGAQPMKSADSKVIIAYNGEVYNYLDLRSELEALGRKFKTASDTEVILQSYEEWGDNCFDKFNGMFAIAIRDLRNDRLVIARDHFGIKPVYFTNLGTVEQPKVLFASEIKGILASRRINVRPNDKVIYRYLKFRVHDDSDETFFENIFRVNAGELLVVDRTGLSRSYFSNLRAELRELAKFNRPYTNSTVNEYRSRLTESVRLRLQSEVPAGTSLSGGLDSSSVAMIINRLMSDASQDSTVESVGAHQNTFSAIFPGSINDEEAYVDAALDVVKGRVDSHKIRPTAAEFGDDLDEFIRTMEEPIISSGPYAQYRVMREATKHVTVLLDGQGADEMMAGYIPYYLVYLRQLRKDRHWVRLLLEGIGSSDVLFRLARFRIKDKLLLRRHVLPMSLLNSDFLESFSGEKYVTVQNNLKERLIEDLFSNSIPSLLRYEDKNTMKFSLEGRVPFLDKEVVKFLFAQSDSAIISGGWNKRILRDAMADFLPDKIKRRRNKIGFTTPEDEWFIRLENRIRPIFGSQRFSDRPYFNSQQVVEAFEGFIDGKNDTSSMLFWRLLNVELWLREFVDEEQPGVAIGGKAKVDLNTYARLNISVG